MAGRQVTVAPCAELVEKSIGWRRADLPTTDGTTIFLPETLALARERAQVLPPLSAFAWYKVMATHQVGLIEWGSFDFRYERAFAADDAALDPSTPRTALSHYARYFARFEEPILARDLFAIAEGLRIDTLVFARYPGLAPAYRAVQARCLASRTPSESSSPHEAFVEWLLCTSLAPDDERPTGALHRALTRRAADILLALRRSDASVEDAAVTAAALYPLVRDAGDPRRLGSYRPPASVRYRGNFKPELGQLLSTPLDSHDVVPPQTPHDLTRKTQLRDLVKNSSEVELAADEMPQELRERALADNLDDELAQRGPPPPSTDDHADGGASDQDTALEATEPGSFAYDEWDAGAGRYRERHCLLWEREPQLRESTFFETALVQHAALAERIRRQFEATAAQLTRRETRQRDGDDLDLDATIEAVIDLRSGRTPSDKVFVRRNKKVRDVAVAFLLDMSSSTADPVDPKADRHARGTQRIIDLEKQALVLLVDALRTLGDRHAIYGFSGYGRKHVELHVIKELHEPLSARVKQRIGAIEPQSATRMGPAIRHTVAKLLAEHAKSRYLFLISDGRPQDQGYGNQGASQRYAVEDTRMALLTAQRQGVIPFCLAIDKAGHDYLGAMMNDMRYAVLADIAMLPERLPELYRALTS